MSEPTSTPAAVFDPTNFGIEVQDLASSILEIPEGELLTRRQMKNAQKIADIISAHREELLNEFTSPGTEASELLGIDVNAPRDLTLPSDKRLRVENTKRELRPVAEEMDHDEATRQTIGDWLGTLPAGKRRPLDAHDIVEKMFAYDLDKLAFKERDYQLAEGVTATKERAEQERVNLERALEDPRSTQISASFIIEKLHANPEKPTTKVSLRTSDEFRGLMQDQFPGISRDKVDELFHSGWAYIEAFFKDVDPSYELFTVNPRQKGTTYVLNNPELVHDLWQDEHGTTQEMAEGVQADQAVAETAKAKQVTYFNGKVIRYADGSETELTSPVAAAFKKRIDERQERSEGAWLSRIATAQEIAQELGLKKEDVEAELKQIISLAGPKAIKSAYSRRGNRVLIARGKLWKN